MAAGRLVHLRVLLSSGWLKKRWEPGERVNISRAKHIERMNRKHSSDFGSLGKMESVMMVYMNDLDPTILNIEIEKTKNKSYGGRPT